MENASSALITVPGRYSLPFWCFPLILKSWPVGSLLRRRAEALNPDGLPADGNSPLVPGAQDGLHAQPAGTDPAELLGKR